MSRGGQIGLVVLAAVVVVLVFVLVRPGDEGTIAPATTQAAPAPETEPEAPPKPEKPEAPTETELDVVGGEPKGGVAEIEVETGDQVVFTVRSDEPEEVHVHGYDLAEDVGPDQDAAFDFAADLEGIYEIELENSAVQIAELRVKP